MYSSDLFDLTGKVAVVTGGSRGMGKSMVQAFAHYGADVVIASRKLPACEALAEEVKAETGQRAVGVSCHVGHWDQCDQLFEFVYETTRGPFEGSSGVVEVFVPLALESEQQRVVSEEVEASIRGEIETEPVYGNR
ncbi:MAG: SDR family NAD(P)-dependent oxidoreductase, partial [Actinomycetia bacterium]|nr:SDR family NAD(P)-dependent oxidoreductase [Actinomycetes bacterium]